MLLADCTGKTELSYTAENVSGNIRTVRNVANILGQLIFTAILIEEAGSDNDLRHRCNNRSVNTSCYAIHN